MHGQRRWRGFWAKASLLWLSTTGWKKKKELRKGALTTTQMPALHLQSMFVALCVLSCSCLTYSKGILENLQVELNPIVLSIHRPVFPLVPSEFSQEPFFLFFLNEHILMICFIKVLDDEH